MSRIPIVTLASLLLFVACSPPPETGATPATAVDNTVVKDANTAQPIDYTVRAEKFVSSTTVDAKLDQVWALMPDVYKRLGLPVDGINSVKRTVTTGQVHVRRTLNNVPLSRFFECGRATLGPNADVYDINLRVETAIGGADNGVVIQSSLAASGAGTGNGGAQVRCSSTGELERRIAEKVIELTPKR